MALPVRMSERLREAAHRIDGAMRAADERVAAQMSILPPSGKYDKLAALMEEESIKASGAWEFVQSFLAKWL
jgi:ubiquinone biosynthesis protein UbiJ